MSEVTIYHNPSCSKSRETLALLAEKGVQPRIVYYLDTPPSVTELRNLLQLLGADARSLLRTKEAPYAELNLADAAISEDAILQAISTNPILLERPIIVRADRAVIGRPPANVLKLL
jgi:arsenate reductase